MLCKTGNKLRLDWYAVCWIVNLEDPRLDVRYSGTPEQVREVVEQLVDEITADRVRPEVKAAREAYYRHIRECEKC